MYNRRYFAVWGGLHKPRGLIPEIDFSQHKGDVFLYQKQAGAMGIGAYTRGKEFHASSFTTVRRASA
jgi:hypothetical protein